MTIYQGEPTNLSKRPLMRIFFVLLLLIQLLIAALSPARAQSPADMIRPGKGRLMTGMLKPGLR